MFVIHQKLNLFTPINSLTLFVVIAMLCAVICAQPLKIKQITERKSCGRDLVERVGRICQSRGGHMTYTATDYLSHERFRRGIVNECCTNKCADHHIYAYCSNGKREVKSTESVDGSSEEAPTQLTADLQSDEIESRAPEAQALVRSIDSYNLVMEEPTTTTSHTERPIESTTYDNRYHDVYVNRNIDSISLNRFLSNLPYNSNDFQVGTVPPEYRIMPMIPSRSRIMY